MENRVDNNFEGFVAQLTEKKTVSLTVFFYQAELHLVEQLKNYLGIEQTKDVSFFSLVEQAKKIKNEDTNKHFWNALLAFNQVSFKPTNNNKQHWLRFVNIIESLQGYAGSQLFDASSIKLKRQHRLFFAYMLAWEHLYYLAGNDDNYSPSSVILNTYSSAHTEEDHLQTVECSDQDCCNTSDAD